MPKPVDPAATRAAVIAIKDWIQDPDGQQKPGRALLADAVRRTARTLEADAPGHSVELRVPPFVAVQCIEGPRHTRGTPPNVAETAPVTFLQLATGFSHWPEMRSAGRVQASGSHVDDVAGVFPVVDMAGVFRDIFADD